MKGEDVKDVDADSGNKNAEQGEMNTGRTGQQSYFNDLLL